MTATSSTESMIKAWIVSDYLRQLGDKEPPAAMKEAARLAIVDSNDGAANKVHAAAGGSYKPSSSSVPDAVIQRAIKICGLTDTKRGNVKPYTGYWSFTRMSPRDAVRVGDCIADGKAAGPKWTKWVLDQMSKVKGTTAAKDQRGLPPVVAAGGSSTVCPSPSPLRGRSASRTAGPPSTATATGTSTASPSPASGASR